MQHIPLVHRLARQLCGFTNGALDYDDLAQEGMIGLIKAADRFDPSRGVQFITYAYLAVRRHLLRVINRQSEAPLSLDAPAADGLPPLGETIAAPAPGDSADLCDVRALVDRLPDPQRRVIVWRYWEGLSLREAGGQIGVSGEWARRIEQKALQSLRQMMEGEAAPSGGSTGSRQRAGI